MWQKTISSVWLLKAVCAICFGMGPVSYTHLDVYKRQLIDRLALALLQHGTIEDKELAMIKEAADLQKGLEE